MTKLLPFLCCLLMLSSAQAIDPSTAPSKKRPTLGMTQDAVRDYYGEPYRRVVVDGRERWCYLLKFAEVYGRKSLVPFRFSSHNVHEGSVTFGRSGGKVESIDWVRNETLGVTD